VPDTGRGHDRISRRAPDGGDPVTVIWLVVRADDGDGPWEIRRDGRVVETVRGHYDAWDVLLRDESLAGDPLAEPLAWWLTFDGGFQATGGAS
jgi:hypothetical protein